MPSEKRERGFLRSLLFFCVKEKAEYLAEKETVGNNKADCDAKKLTQLVEQQPGEDDTEGEEKESKTTNPFHRASSW